MLAVALLASPIARADQGVPDRVPAKAKQLADRGRAYHDARDYTRAIAAFQEAYALAPSPALLFDLAQDYRLAGNCDEAAWMYRRYLDTNPSDEHRALAETHLHHVERCGHGTLALAIGPAQVAAQLHAPRRPEPAVRRAAVFTGSSGEHEQQLGLALAACGGVLLAGAAYFAYDSLDASNTVSGVYHHGGDGTGLGPVDARGQRSETYAEWLGVGGALAAASGITVYLLGRRASAHHLEVVPTAHGAAVHASWQF